ncbi:MAG: 30S ribosomal protein S8 [Candidatus Aenigmarchaeota archaeon]|nr:30S ribosomal protein S8 [Candidatus Aenigmarchaeota archaeon]
MRHDILPDVMYSLNNADKFGKQECIVPASSTVKSVLKILQEEGYIGSFEFVDDQKSGKFRVEMKGKINMSRAVRPRFAAKTSGFKKWETRFLPARDMGTLILSTPTGVMTKKTAVEKGTGGKLVAYVY